METGCTIIQRHSFGLAKGMDLETSVQLAKDYVSGALKAMPDLEKEADQLTTCGILNATTYVDRSARAIG
jgi:hydroxymethylpyrimidine/phosphomethylpyrimidine kinase